MLSRQSAMEFARQFGRLLTRYTKACEQLKLCGDPLSDFPVFGGEHGVGVLFPCLLVHSAGC